jgi:hypothetical protein
MILDGYRNGNRGTILRLILIQPYRWHGAQLRPFHWSC